MSSQRFNFDYFGINYQECFFHLSKYVNGNTKVSLFGKNPKTKQTEHFLDISLDQNTAMLEDDEIVIDNYLKNEIVNQLLELGILEEKIGNCFVITTEYPIYKLNIYKLLKYSYEAQKISA